MMQARMTRAEKAYEGSAVAVALEDWDHAATTPSLLVDAVLWPGTLRKKWVETRGNATPPSLRDILVDHLQVQLMIQPRLLSPEWVAEVERFAIAGRMAADIADDVLASLDALGVSADVTRAQEVAAGG